MFYNSCTEPAFTCLKLLMKTLDVCAKTSEQKHWHHSGVFTVNHKLISHLAVVFLVFLLLTFTVEQVKSQLGSKSYHSKKPWFIVVRGKFRTCDTHKMVLFHENSLQFKAIDNFDKKLHFKVCYGVLNLPWVFFQIYLYYRFIDPFSSPNLFKILMECQLCTEMSVW